MHPMAQMSLFSSQSKESDYTTQNNFRSSELSSIDCPIVVVIIVVDISKVNDLYVEVVWKLIHATVDFSRMDFSFTKHDIFRLINELWDQCGPCRWSADDVALSISVAPRAGPRRAGSPSCDWLWAGRIDSCREVQTPKRNTFQSQKPSLSSQIESRVFFYESFEQSCILAWHSWCACERVWLSTNQVTLRA